MKTTWVVVANSVSAQVCEVTGKKSLDAIKTVHTLVHTNTRLPAHELVTDRPGHYKSAGEGRGSFGEDYDPKEKERDKFAKQISDLLEEGRVNNKFASVILVAEPHFHGLLLKHLHKPLKQLIEQSVEKEIITHSEQELKKYILSLFELA